MLLISQVLGLAVTLAVPSWSSLVRKRSADGISTVGSIGSRAKAVGWLLSLVGQACYCIENALVRLIAIAFSNAVLAVLLAAEWGAAWETDQLSVRLGIWLVGLLASNLAKYANHSNNPAWPFMNSTNGGHNVLLLVLAALAVAEISLRPKYERLPTVQRRQATGASSATESQGSFLLATLGAGALLYSLHTFLTDTGTMIAWGCFPAYSPDGG